MVSRAAAFGGDVKWRAHASSSAPAPEGFAAWFADPASPVDEAIVAANDAISGTKSLGGGRFEATVRGAKFPLVELTPTMTFTCARVDAQSVRITLDAQEMRATGPAWATKIIVRMASIMDTASTSTFRVADGVLNCEADVEASFTVPRWVPVPLAAIQDGGANAIQKQVDADAAAMVANLLKSGR